jgi:hypothetical protein
MMYSKRADGRVRKRFCSGKEMGKEPGQAGNLIFTVPARVVVTTRVAYLFTVVIASLSWMRLCRARVYLGWSGHLVSFVIPACIRLLLFCLGNIRTVDGGGASSNTLAGWPLFPNVFYLFPTSIKHFSQYTSRKLYFCHSFLFSVLAPIGGAIVGFRPCLSMPVTR